MIPRVWLVAEGGNTMRVLVATTAGSGHFEPLVPFARACLDAGHDVVVAAPESFGATVAGKGLEHLPLGEPPPAEMGAVFASLPPLDGASPADIETGNVVVLREVFARLDAGAALPALLQAMSGWRPDVVLREQAELASYVAAEAAGVPHVQLNTGLSSFMDMVALVEEPLVALGATPGLAGLRETSRLTLVPESVDGASASQTGPLARFRVERPAAAHRPLPDWWGGSEEPLVYVTFGTVAASVGLFPELYRAVADAFAEVPARVLMTTGEAGDPEALGPVAPNVHVERFWPQADVLPHVAAVVAHGGLSTTLGVLSAGVPLILLPLFADQPYNADRVEETGAAVVLRGGPAQAGRLPGLLDRVLEDPSVRSAAQRVAQEISGLPPVPGAVALLERVASTTMGR